MKQLITSFNKEEEQVLEIYKDDFQVLSVLDKPCYILYDSGKYTFKECFGQIGNSIEQKQRYKLAKPRRVIKIYQYYVMENEEEPGEWYICEEQKNGAIEAISFCESLEFAMAIL